jgi:hypothetical protein
MLVGLEDFEEFFKKFDLNTLRFVNVGKVDLWT